MVGGAGVRVDRIAVAGPVCRSILGEPMDPRKPKPNAIPRTTLAFALALAALAALALLGPRWVDVGASLPVLAPLFTRMSLDQALEHPRRRRIFDYVRHHPGANFREVGRNTGIAAGTVRHHLNVLARSGIIVEHQHASTVRLFENIDAFRDCWADQVILREPALAELYEWLHANPASPQRGALDAMRERGWSRSTTQHRLGRLVDAGLVGIKLQGRLKLYTAADRRRPPGPAVSVTGAVA